MKFFVDTAEIAEIKPLGAPAVTAAADRAETGQPIVSPAAG
jgi:hypothetical protein